MNKFPVLSTMQSVFSFFAIIIILGGFMGAIVAAANTGQYSDSPNIMLGVTVFIASLSMASGFLFISEVINWMLRVENHIDKIQRHLVSVDTALTMEDDTYLSGQHNLDEEDTKSTRVFAVKSRKLLLFAEPVPDSELLEDITNLKYVRGLNRDSSGLWVYVKAVSNNQTSYGWIQSNNLDDSKGNIETLDLIPDETQSPGDSAYPPGIIQNLNQKDAKFVVDVPELEVFEEPSIGSNITYVLTNIKTVFLHERDAKGDWLRIQASHDGKTIEGWTPRAYLNIDRKRIKDLPIR